MINEERPRNERVIVMVDGAKASADKSGAVPLEYALREVTRTSDEVLVLAVFNAEAVAEAEASPLPRTVCCCMGEERLDQNSTTNTSDRDSCIWFLEEEINQRKETYRQIFRPYYDRCKGSGVKFRVKIAASFQPLASVAEEANNVDATWIVMDRCFVGEQSFQIHRDSCSVALVSSDGVIVANRNSIVQEPNPNPKSPENKYEASFPSLAGTINGGGESSNTSNNPAELLGKSSASDDDNVIFTGFSKVNLAARMPLQLSWEVLEEVTGGFTRMTCMEENESYKLYCGYLSDHHSQFLVKILPGQLDYVVEAEKKAALAMYHRNILGLFGYHISEDATVLVYPFTRRWTLSKFLHCLKGKRANLTFPEKLKVAIGIARGIRYMHEECPRGPIVHGDLRPCNIFLNSDFEPLITSFGEARWVQLKQALPISSKRLVRDQFLDIKSLALIKFDVFHFGILLLRLFCRRFTSQDDKIFIEWARPLLLQRAYHELLDEDTEYVDMYGIYTVMRVAVQCLRTKPTSRPSMAEVIWLLKGEASCAVELSPSSEDSPNVDVRV